MEGTASLMFRVRTGTDSSSSTRLSQGIHSEPQRAVHTLGKYRSLFRVRCRVLGPRTDYSHPIGALEVVGMPRPLSISRNRPESTRVSEIRNRDLASQIVIPLTAFVRLIGGVETYRSSDNSWTTSCMRRVHTSQL